MHSAALLGPDSELVWLLIPDQFLVKAVAAQVSLEPIFPLSGRTLKLRQRGLKVQWETNAKEGALTLL